MRVPFHASTKTSVRILLLLLLLLFPPIMIGVAGSWVLVLWPLPNDLGKLKSDRKDFIGCYEASCDTETMPGTGTSGFTYKHGYKEAPCFDKKTFVVMENTLGNARQRVYIYI